MKGLLKFFLGIFYKTFCQKYWYLWTYFVLLIVRSINFGLYCRSIFLFSIPHTVPNISHSKENWGGLFFFQKILGLLELLDKSEEINGNWYGSIWTVSSFVSLLCSQWINFFLAINKNVLCQYFVLGSGKTIRQQCMRMRFTFFVWLEEANWWRHWHYRGCIEQILSKRCTRDHWFFGSSQRKSFTVCSSTPTW